MMMMMMVMISRDVLDGRRCDRDCYCGGDDHGGTDDDDDDDDIVFVGGGDGITPSVVVDRAGYTNNVG